MDPLPSLMRYKRWTNELLYAAVKSVPTEELTRTRPIIFGSLIRTLNHTAAMDEVWQAHLLGKPHNYDTRNPEHCPALDDIRAAQETMDNWYVNYTENMSAEQCSEIINVTFIGGNQGRMTCEQILLHVVNHGTYHRGHVTAMMFDLSIKPPTTDYPVFLVSGGEQ